MKTASIVNYGLVPLLRPGSEGSLFAHWNDGEKQNLLAGVTDDKIDEGVIERYVEFCTTEINKFAGAVKDSVVTTRWTPVRKVKDRLLTTTVVNGIIHALRQLSASNKLGQHSHYKSSLVGLDTFDFSSYTSSHYNELGMDLAKKYFGV